MIYICIPALNEARTIGVLLWKIRQVMDEFPRDYHVLVLDDGSSDDTREVLEPYLRVLPVTVLRNERTLGYAAGLERLIREAAQRSTHPKRDGVVTLQADFTESPDDIPVLLKRLEGGADIVGVTVTHTEGELPRAVRWSRRGLPWLLSRAPLPKEVGDPLSGFRAYRVSVLRRALQDYQGKAMLTKHGWAVNAELLLAVLPHVRRAEGAEVSLRYTRRERPTRFSPWSTALELWDLARKAPRRLAQARAAAATADARAAAAPPAPQPQRAPQPAPASGSAAAPQRPPHQPTPPAQRHAAHQAPARQRPPRQQAGPAAQKPAQPQAQAQRPAPQPSIDTIDAPRVDDLPTVDGPQIAAADAASVEAPVQTKPKRRRPPRRKSAAAKAAAAEAAEGTAQAETAPVSASLSVDTGGAGDSGDSGDSGDAAAAPKKRASRPRRPRRPRQAGPSAAPSGEGEGGGE